MSEQEEKQKLLVDSLARTLAEEGHTVSRFETHISYVIVAAPYAYKIKKAIAFPFLDFSTLERRHFYCLEELRLNRRLAPDLYLDVIAITGDPACPIINGKGDVIEYAVRMHAFDQTCLWTHRLAEGLLTQEEIDALADKLSAFHLSASSASSGSEWGNAELIEAHSRETTETLDTITDANGKKPMQSIAAWWSANRGRMRERFAMRKENGMVRECHGDLHSANLLTLGDKVEVFDCIEFNDGLRWIDVMNDLAFIWMELHFYGRADMAARLLNRYLETTGDYEGLAVFTYYAVQRALVRAKILLLRAQQTDEDRETFLKQGNKYLSLAAKFTQPHPVVLMLMHGFSGSGKTSIARQVVEIVGAVQIRSDVERKRMQGLGSTSRNATGLYDQHVTERTYERLLSLSSELLAACFSVVVDAAFFLVHERERFAGLALEIGASFFIFDVQASIPALESRLQARAKEGLDASDADITVLHRQLAFAEPLSKKETTRVIAIDIDKAMDGLRARLLCEPIFSALASDSDMSWRFGIDHLE